MAAAFDGAPCASCGSPLRLTRGVEVGNIFQLGTRYAEALEARYTDEAGTAHPIVMGSYGIGLERLLACVAEEHRDQHGLVLPVSVAPYQVALVALARKEETWQAAEQVFAALVAAGIEVLYDDRRDLSAGVKFTDADLRGLPLRVVIGERSLAAGGAELSRRGRGGTAHRSPGPTRRHATGRDRRAARPPHPCSSLEVELMPDEETRYRVNKDPDM